MRIIWTYTYNPFIMGGNTRTSIATAITPIETREFSGIPLFSFITPRGTIRIAEGVTGAIVGNSFEEVENHILSASLDTIIEQLRSARKNRDEAKVLNNKDFFNLYKY